jgi:hypothetical protein
LHSAFGAAAAGGSGRRAARGTAGPSIARGVAIRFRKSGGVGAAETAVERQGGGKAVGILIFIGILVALNILSYVFDWGWIFY